MIMQCHEPLWPGTEEYLRDFLEKAERLRIPLTGSLELTRRCNLNCVHCYLGPRAGRQALQGLEINAARIRSLIDEMTEAGCMNLLITGGEPLLRDDFPEIYRHAKMNGLLVTLFTNGTLVTEKIIDLLRELPPVEVEISIYGATAEVYESVTRVPGSYETCFRGIRALLDRGVRVNLKTILMTVNRQEFFAMERLAKDLGVRFRFDAAIQPGLDGDNTPLGLRVTPEEAIEKEMSAPGAVRRWKDFFERFKDCALGSELYGCSAGLTAFHIDPFGRLLPCMMALELGYETSGVGFKKVWATSIQRIRDKKAGADFACRECDKINICGYCPGFFKLENGLEDVRSEYICRMGNLRFQYIHDHPEKGDHDGQPEQII